MARGIGGEGGARGGRDPNAGRSGPSGGGTGAGGRGLGPSSVGQGLSTRARNLNELANLAAGRPSSLSGAGKSAPAEKGKAGTKKAGALPPGLNPLKYSPNPTQSYEATLSNIGTLIGTAALTMAGGGLPGVATAADEVMGSPLGLGFEKPTGIVPGSTYDKSEAANASTGQVGSNLGKTSQLASQSAEQKTKKKKTTKPGFSLLAGVGGTLLGT